MLRILLCLLLAIGLHTHARAEADARLPAALEPWRDWVLHNHPQLRCPELQGPRSRACWWPGTFNFVVGDGVARFEGRINVWARSTVPVPGSRTQWPESVQVDGRPMPVAELNGEPVLHLEAGDYLLSGRIPFERRPEELNLPPAYALLGLTLDGQNVADPRRTASGVWLGRQDAATAVQADSLQVQVYRLLVDGTPSTLQTQVRLQVAGRAREQRLSQVLPQDFEFTRLDSPLNARLEGRDLVLQLRPGSHVLNLGARALKDLAQVAPGIAVEPWPAEEIWSYQAAPELRESSASGSLPIDPVQADVPPAWHGYAAFVLGAEAPLSLSYGHRGLAVDTPNRLRLERQLWLSFDGSRWEAQDRISGQMQSGWRLDSQPPFALTRARAQDEPVLVTQRDDTTGVELRHPELLLETGATAPREGRLPASGWRADFESVELGLELPAGWRLLHLSGADTVYGAWTSRFDLRSLGVLLLMAVLGWRLLGLRLTGLLLTVAVLGRGEWYEPTLWLAGVLLVLAVLVRLPAGRARRVGTLAAWGGWVAAIVLCLPFIVQQARLGLAPSLERADLSGSAPRPRAAVPQVVMADLVADAAVQEADMATRSAAMPAPMAPPPPPAPGKVSKELYSASPVTNIAQQQTRRNLERYATGTNVQAGRAQPGWRWTGIRVGFEGRVDAQTELRPWLLPPWLNQLWRLLAVAAVVGLLLGTARWLQRRGSLPRGRNWLLSGALLLGSGAGQAAELPDEGWLNRLEARLLEAAPCRAQGCGRMGVAQVTAQQRSLNVQIEMHAQALTALPLPMLAETRWQDVRLDGETTRVLQQGGQFWVVVQPGIHRVELGTRLPAGQLQRLRFALPPARLRCSASGYVCAGLQEGRLQSDTLELIPESAGGADAGADPGDGVDAARGTAIPAFVRIERDLNFELDWEVTTTIHRIAPQNGGISLQVPLLEGERLLSEEFEVKDGKVAVSLGSGTGWVSFTSRLEPVSLLELRAPDWSVASEVWRLRPGPAWRMAADGVPPVSPVGYSEEWVHTYYPLPGEALRVALDRPAAAPGATLAIDSLELRTQVGSRQRDSVLALSVRATQGGQHTVQLPKDVEVKEVRIHGSKLNLRAQDGVLQFPVQPGVQRVEIEFRDRMEPALRQDLPAVDLRAETSNLRLSYTSANTRWWLWAAGPGVGPVLGAWLWVVMLVSLVLVLHGLGQLPMSLAGALLVAVGAAWIAPWILPLVLVWAWALQRHTQWSPRLLPWPLRLLQLALLGYSVWMLMHLGTALLDAVLGGPSMDISGLQSNLREFHWFLDQSGGAVPAVTIWSLPSWVFQGLAVLWTVWLGYWIYRQVLGGWHAARRSGAWRLPRTPSTPAPAPAADQTGATAVEAAAPLDLPGRM